MGIVLVPGVNDTELYNLSQSYGGMCNKTFQDELITQYSAKVAIYNVRVDRLTVLKMPFPDIIFNMANRTTMAFAAFRANITSPAVFVVSGDQAVTKGAGFVVSVALLFRVEAGILNYLQWYDLGCGECGGSDAALCIHSTAAEVRACATPLTNCSCEGNTQPVNSTTGVCSLDEERFEVCSTAVNSAWQGTDVNLAAFQTGPQVTRLNSFSIVGLFNIARDKFFQAKNFIYENVAASWGAINSDVNQQYVDFAGGLSQYSRPSPSPPPRPFPPSPPSPTSPPSPESPPTDTTGGGVTDGGTTDQGATTDTGEAPADAPATDEAATDGGATEGGATEEAVTEVAATEEVATDAAVEGGA